MAAGRFGSIPLSITTLPCVKRPTNDGKGAENRAKTTAKRARARLRPARSASDAPKTRAEPAEAPPRPTPRRRKLAREGPDAGKGAPDRAPKRAKNRPTASCTAQAPRRRAPAGNKSRNHTGIIASLYRFDPLFYPQRQSVRRGPACLRRLRDGAR